MKRRKTILLGLLMAALAGAWLFRERMGIGLNMARQRFVKRTVDDRLREFGGAARQRWAPLFKAGGVIYPPKKVVFLALKNERVFEVYGGNETGLHFVRRFPILAASGTLGPKLREGDRQVPEGIYEIESLNPNSAYHVSLRLNYPNSFDRAQAAKDGRTNLGSDIMIHGKSVSVGCIALGDEAVEELFTLAADAGAGNVSVIVSPTDFRTHSNFQTPGDCPIWAMELWQEIAGRLVALPSP